MNSTGQLLNRLLWACVLAMGFLMVVGILGSDRLVGIVQRPVVFISGLLPAGLSQGLASAITSATVAVVFYALVFWLVMTAWQSFRAK